MILCHSEESHLLIKDSRPPFVRAESAAADGGRTDDYGFDCVKPSEQRDCLHHSTPLTVPKYVFSLSGAKVVGFDCKS